MRFKGLFKKILFWSFTLTILACLLGIAYVFKSITPLYEIDQNNKRISILGGKYKLEFNKDVQKKIKVALQEKNFRVYLDGDIATKNFNTIMIDAEQTDMSLESYGKKLIYHCRASRQKSDLIKTDGDEIKLKIDGEAICQVVVPEGKKLEILYRSGILRLYSLEQDLDLKILDGMVIWGIPNYSKFKLNLEIDDGDVYGSRDRFNSDKAKYHADINVKSAIIFFR